MSYLDSATAAAVKASTTATTAADSTGTDLSQRVDTLFSGGKIGSFNLDKLRELLGTRFSDTLGERTTGITTEKGTSKNTFSLGGISNFLGMNSGEKEYNKGMDAQVSTQEEVRQSVDSVYDKTVNGSEFSIDDLVKKFNQTVIKDKLPFITNLTDEGLTKATVVTNSVDKDVLVKTTVNADFVGLKERSDFKVGFDKYLADKGLVKASLSAEDLSIEETAFTSVFTSSSKLLTKAYINENVILTGTAATDKTISNLKAFNVYEPLRVDTSTTKYVFTKDSKLFEEAIKIDNIQDKSSFGATSTLSEKMGTSSGVKYTKEQELPNVDFGMYIGFLKEGVSSKSNNDLKNLKEYDPSITDTRTDSNNKKLESNSGIAEKAKINPQALLAAAGSVTSVLGNAGGIIDNFADSTVSYYQDTVNKTGAAVKEGFTIANGITGAISELTGFKNILDPKMEEKVNGFLDKMGLGTQGIGNDTKSYLDSTIDYVTIMEIDGIKLDNTCFLSYCEKHDFIKGKAPERFIKFRLNAKHMQKIKLNGKNKKVTITRYYGYRQASQPNKDAGPNMANYKTYEILKDYSLKSVKQNLKLSKENAKEAEGTDKELKTRAVFEAIVIPPALTTNQKATNFNGIPVNSKISTIIGAAFKACYAKGQLALSNPVNDLVLDKVVFTPMTFPQVLTKMQKDYKIFEGGFNIFIDSDVYYVVNKDGPNNIKFDQDWTYVFKTNPKLGQKTYTTVSPSRKKIIFNLFEDDITMPTDKSELKPVEDRYNKGSKTGLTQGTTKDTIVTHVVPVAHDYILGKPESNLPVEDFVVKLKNSFVTFKPGDNIEIHYRKKIYKGTAKAWGAEHNPNGRVVILNATAKQSKGAGSILDRLAPSNLIETYQETMAGLTARTDNAITDYTQRGLDYVSTNTGVNILNVNSMKEAYSAVSSRSK